MHFKHRLRNFMQYVATDKSRSHAPKPHFQVLQRYEINEKREILEKKNIRNGREKIAGPLRAYARVCQVAETERAHAGPPTATQ